MSSLRLMAIDAICQRGSVRDSDVATLRRTFLLEPQIAPSDVDALFRAHSMAKVTDPSWADFFVETLTDYVVRELEPQGYVTAAHAGWLIARISNAGRVRSKTEHDLLLNVIDKARWVPESLMAFALAQIRDAVVTGEGPLRAGAPDSAGSINLAEVEQVRALLYAYGNEGPRAVTQTEAEILLDIEQALIAQPASLMDAASPIDTWPLECWKDLLGKAVINAALAASGYRAPSREEALNETAQPIAASYRPMLAEERAIERLELQRVEIITGEPVAAADPGRLATRLRSAGLKSSRVHSVLDEAAAHGFELSSLLVKASQSARANAA